MPMMIETDLKDVLNKLDQRFDRLDQKLDKIESDLTDLKVDMATVKADLTTVKEEVKDLRGSQRAQIWALIGIIFTAVVSAVIKFGFFSNRPLAKVF
jgi:t-SNARE complex subunit (syntaxin)